MIDTATANLLIDTKFDAIPSSATIVTTPPAMATPSVNVPFYVASVSDPTRHRDLVGTILSARPAPSGDGWIARITSTDDLARVYGTVVNPTMENGKTYLVRDAWIVRYNDEDHRGDRHRPGSALSILAHANGTPWAVDDDAVGGVLESSAWIEVTYTPAPGVSDVGQGAVETPIETIDPALNQIGGRFRGLARAEANGLILKNPERVYGENYIVSLDTTRNPYIATWVPNDELGEFLYHGYVSIYGAGIDFDMTQRQPGLTRDEAGEIVWAKLAMKRPAPVEQEGRASSLRQELNSLRNSFTAFNEALNEMADNRGHCSDYDEIVERLGMETRTKEWSVEVRADITFTDSSPSSRVDSELTSAYGIDIEASEIRVDAKVTVTITVTAGSEQSARDAVDSSEIEDRLDSFSDLEVTDWEITDVTRCD